jgi:hypothetical protein
MQENEEQNLPASIDYQAGYLKLPVDQDQFGRFVAGLLGRPQSASKSFSGSFTFDFGNIQNIHYLIEQRISQQNQAFLVEFQARMYFNDGSSITLNGIDSLLSYREFRPLVPSSLNLAWVYLIKFNNKDYPEKQEIIVDVATKVEDREDYYLGYSGSDHHNSISVRIHFTERTWGTDLLFIISEYIKTIMDSEGRKMQRLLSRHSTIIGWISGILVFLGFSASGIFALSSLTQERLQGLRFNEVENLPVGEAILVILNEFSKSQATLFFGLNIFLLLSIALSFAFGLWMTSTVNVREMGFLPLTEQGTGYKIRKLKELKKRWINFYASIIMALVVNITSSYIFLYLNSR